MILNVFVPNWFLRRQLLICSQRKCTHFSINVETHSHILVRRIFSVFRVWMGTAQDHTRLGSESLIQSFPSCIVKGGTYFSCISESLFENWGDNYYKVVWKSLGLLTYFALPAFMHVSQMQFSASFMINVTLFLVLANEMEAKIACVISRHMF